MIWTISRVLFVCFFFLNQLYLSIVYMCPSSARLIAAKEPRFSASAPTDVCPLTAMSVGCIVKGKSPQSFIHFIGAKLHFHKLIKQACVTAKDDINNITALYNCFTLVIVFTNLKPNDHQIEVTHLVIV